MQTDCTHWQPVEEGIALSGQAPGWLARLSCFQTACRCTLRLASHMPIPTVPALQEMRHEACHNICSTLLDIANLALRLPLDIPDKAVSRATQALAACAWPPKKSVWIKP